MATGYVPFDAGRSAPRELPERVFLELPHPNIGRLERFTTLVTSVAFGAMIVRRTKRLGPWLTTSALMGVGVVAARAIGGYCPLRALLSEKVDDPLHLQDDRVRQFLPRILRSISIRASREEIVAKLKDLPTIDGARFEILGEPTSEEVQWRCQRMIAGPGSARFFTGVIRLIDGPPKKGVELQASLDVIPEGCTETEVELVLRHILRATKQFVEAGEIATTLGQSHGKRRHFSLRTLIGGLRHVGAVLERN